MIDRESFHLRPAGERAFGFAQAVRVGKTLHLAGSLSVDDSFTPLNPGDMAAQLTNVYQSIVATLKKFDATMKNVVRETIFVTDMDAFLLANGTRIAVYDGYPLPATTAVEVRRLAFPACMVEIEVTAVLS